MFILWSDIDLAAWGIPPQRFYEAVADITGLSGEFQVDLVDPRSCQPTLHQDIVEEGMDL